MFSRLFLNAFGLMAALDVAGVPMPPELAELLAVEPPLDAERPLDVAAAPVREAPAVPNEIVAAA